MFTATLRVPDYSNMVLFGDTYSKSMDQSGKVANPGRGQLKREK